MEDVKINELIKYIHLKVQTRIALTAQERFIYLVYIEGLKEDEAHERVESLFNVKHFVYFPRKAN